MRHALLCAVAALSLMAGASSAQAAIVDVIYNGAVTSITDQTNIFNGAAVGDPFQISYHFDTTKGYVSSSNAYGGSLYPVPTPSLGVTVKINGVTGPEIYGSYYGQILGYSNSNPFFQQWHTAEDRYTNLSNISIDNYATGTVYSKTPGSTIPSSITTPFTYTVQPGDKQYMYIGYFAYDNNLKSQTVYTDIHGDVTSIKETLEGAPGQTPGFGLFGLAALLLAGGFARARAARG